MAAGQFLTTKLMRSNNQTPWGFRLQGGKEFMAPLSVVKVTGASLSEQSGMQVGDIILKINGKETDQMRHKEAQDAIIGAGNFLELYIERGQMNTWKPTVTPVGDIRPRSQNENPVFTQTSLSKSPEAQNPIGSGHNTSAKPFAVQSKPALVHKQYNSPVNLYSEKNIEETLNAHTQVLATGATGINFMRPDAPVNKESAVYQMVHDEELRKSQGLSASPDPRAVSQERVVKHVEAPVGKPATPQEAAPVKNICGECERLIVGLTVRINNKLLHPECFRCATCGTSLKQSGYFNINDKLYCDIHARQVKTFFGGSNSSYASQQAPTITVPPSDYSSQNGFLANQSQTESKLVDSAPQPSIPMSYQPPMSNTTQSITTQQTYSTMKKYSPVSPPTAPQPFPTTNRNSMFVNEPQPPFATETHSTALKGSSKFSWPPNTQYRQASQHNERPKSCYSSLPNQAAYSVTTTTHRSSHSTQYTPSTQDNNANLRYPKTASFASSTQTTQTAIPTQLPVVKPLPQYNTSSAINTRQFSTPSSGKTSMSDSKTAPRRGRGLLQSQLTGGVIPFCGYCTQPIRGQYIMALNKSWCPNHFVCANALCKRSLEQNGFVEEQGRLYCETCYETHFAPSCAKCNQRIKGDCLNALDRQWHPNCFTCSYCKKPFGNSSFYLEDGHPYCEKDWNDLFTTKCVGCGFPIAAGDRWVEALNQNYHSSCFKCTVCRGNLEGQSFFAKGGRPYCKAHAR